MTDEVQIRPAEERDAARFVELTMRANPTIANTPEVWLHRRRTEPARARSLMLVAERAGRVVGHGSAALDAWVPASTTVSLNVVVDEPERGRGLGSRIYDALEGHARAIGGTARQSMFFERPEAVAFAAARGFEQVRAAFPASVDPSAVELGAPAGIVVAPFAELDPRDVHRVDEEATFDEPTTEQVPGFDYDEWLDLTWNRPGFSLDGSFAALVDGKPVSVSMLYVAPALARAVNGFTGTLRAHRGDGLALACKIASLRWAAAHGIESVVTANDDTNAPMLAINQRLGYAPIGRLLTMRRER